MDFGKPQFKSREQYLKDEIDSLKVALKELQRRFDESEKSYKREMGSIRRRTEVIMEWD